MAISASGRISGASSGPTVREGIVSPAGIVGISAPDDHFSASPNGCVAGSRNGRASGTGVGPSIGSRTVSAASVQIPETITRSSPDDHFSAGPYRGVIQSTGGGVRAAGGCPGIIKATKWSIGYDGKDKGSSSRYNPIVGLACLF